MKDGNVGEERTRRSDKALLGAHYEVGKLAALIDMSPRFIKERIKAGELEGYRLGNRIVVSAESVKRYLENRRMACVA